MNAKIPNATRFEDLFTGAAPFAGPGKSPRLMTFRAWDRKGRSYVDGYVHLSDAPSVTVAGVTPPVAEVLERDMLHVANDSIYFEVIPHGDGTASVYAKNNAILGSRLLAVIDAATVPTFTDVPTGV